MNTTHADADEIPETIVEERQRLARQLVRAQPAHADPQRLGWAEAADWRNRHDGVSFEHCRLDVYVQYPPNGSSRADPSNADNVGKPIIDGFTKAGLWPDDNWRHVEGPSTG